MLSLSFTPSLFLLVSIVGGNVFTNFILKMFIFLLGGGGGDVWRSGTLPEKAQVSECATDRKYKPWGVTKHSTSGCLGNIS